MNFWFLYVADISVIVCVSALRFYSRKNIMYREIIKTSMFWCNVMCQINEQLFIDCYRKILFFRK